MKINGMHCTSTFPLSVVPTSQSEVTVIQSDDNQPRQHDESSQVEHRNGFLHVCYDCLNT